MIKCWFFISLVLIFPEVSRASILDEEGFFCEPNEPRYSDIDESDLIAAQTKFENKASYFSTDERTELPQLILTGDADGDGDVDGDDLVTIQINFGSTNPPPGDADVDGDVDGDDLITIQINFGNNRPRLFNDEAKSIPEPSGFIVFLGTITSLFLRRGHDE